MKTLFVCVYLAAAAVLFAEQDGYQRQYSADVYATSNGKEKIIYATINKQKTENKIQLIITELDSGALEIRSEKFKLGKMPFSSSFHFTIPKTNRPVDNPNTVSIENLDGIYKVAASKAKALLSGTLSPSEGELNIETSGMGKTLKIRLTYSKTKELQP